MDSELFNVVYRGSDLVLNKIDPWLRLSETKAVKAIQNILNAVCEIHKLPLALTWMKHRDFDDLYIRESASYMNDSSMKEYDLACLRNPLKKGENVAGKAVPDVSLLDLADYPFVDLAVKLGHRAALAVRLKCMSVGEIEYVAEVFLHKNLKDSVEQNNLINDIISSLCEKCENSGTVKLQIQACLFICADPKLDPSEEVEASQIPSVAVSKSSFPNVGLNLKEKIQDNRVETDEPHEQADPKLDPSEEVEASQIPSVAVSKSSFPNVGLNLKEKIQDNRVETDEPHEQVGETHDTQQSKRINKRKKNDTQQTKYTPEPRKPTSVVWKFFNRVQENGEVHAKCPVCNKELSAKSRNGTTSLHKHGCFKDWKKDEKQQSVSNVESSAKANPKNRASPKIGAGAPLQAKRRKLVANVGEEREEEETSSACIGQAAVSGLAHDQVQEDYTAKETPGRGLKDQEHHLVSGCIIEPLPTETQSSGQQATNMAIDGTGGVPQVECTNMELTAEDGNLATSTTSSIATTPGFPVISAASELRSFLSQSPQLLLSPTENDRFCSLLNAEINATSYKYKKFCMGVLLAKVRRLKEAIATCPLSSRPETLPPQGYKNFDLAFSQSARSLSDLKAQITSLQNQAAQMQEQLKATYEQIEQIKLKLYTLEKEDAVMQTRALQISKATADRLEIDSIVAGMPALFDFVKQVPPKP